MGIVGTVFKAHPFKAANFEKFDGSLVSLVVSFSAVFEGGWGTSQRWKEFLCCECYAEFVG